MGGARAPGPTQRPAAGPKALSPPPLGQKPPFAEADPAAFVVTRIEIDFLRPARIDDALVVETCVNRLRGPRIFFSQRLLRDGEPICRAEVSAAAIHSDGRIRRPAAEEAAIWKRLLPE